MGKYIQCIGCGLPGNGTIIYGIKRDYPVCNNCLRKKYGGEKPQYMANMLQIEVDERLGLIIK